MCGICGYAGLSLPTEGGSTIQRMHHSLRHRGPEGGGEHRLTAQRGEFGGWFGHRRLKILDLSAAAHQPMCSADGQIVLTYNGEIYNFRELRRELSSAGFAFSSSGDTEVVLRAYEHWGEGFVQRIDGMFALAIWDGRGAGKLLLARDRTGKKPLYWSDQAGRITFGSEIKAIVAAPWIERRPAWERLPEFLTFGYVPHPATLYEGIHQVPPGSVCTVEGGEAASTRRYWNWLDTPLRAQPRAALATSIRTAVTGATERRMIADVPLGALLSGGIDSSIVVGIMTRAATEPVRTFTIGFSDEPSYDERDYATLVARHFGTRHTDLDVRADAVGLMDRLLWHHDQPYADSSAIPTYAVCELAASEVTVALNGDGGDEVFGGYDRFKAAALAEHLPRGVGRLGQALVPLLPRDDSYYSRRRRLERFLEQHELDPRARYQSWIEVIPPDLLGSMLGRSVEPAEVLRSMQECYEDSAHLPLLDQILYANFKTYLPDDLAVKMDRMSMAHSLETRSPFLDTAVVELLASVRARRKVGLRSVKPLLREAFSDLVPEVIFKRRKHGFGVPMNRWFRTDLREMFEDEVLADGARIAAVIDPGALRALWEEHQTGARENGYRLWTLLTLEHWLRSLERPVDLDPPVANEAILSAS